jgi:hypothetical protein
MNNSEQAEAPQPIRPDVPPHRILSDIRVAGATTLAAPIPADGNLPAHQPGEVVYWTWDGQVPDLGRVLFPWPLPSGLILHASRTHLRRAHELRDQFVAASTGTLLFPINNYDPVYEFLGESIAGVLLAFSSVDNFASERIPAGFQFVVSTGKQPQPRRTLLRMGIETRLSRIIPAALGKSNLMLSNPQLWGDLIDLKTLRDRIQHDFHPSEARSDQEIQSEVLTRLLGERNPERWADIADGVMAAYR